MMMMLLLKTALAVACCTWHVAGAPLRVFVLAGQSNMEGQAEVSKQYPNGTEMNGTLKYQLHDPRTAAEFAEVWDTNGNTWATRDDVWVWFNEHGNTDDGTWGNLTVGYGVGGSPGKIGPEFGFGYGMSDVRTDEDQILIIKTAWGGKTLGGDFRPPSSGGTVGPYYRRMTAMVKEVLSPSNMSRFFGDDITARGFVVAGFGWFQGWNDGCSATLVAEYEKNLVNLIQDLRKVCPDPRACCLCCALARKTHVPVFGVASERLDGWSDGPLGTNAPGIRKPIHGRIHPSVRADVCVRGYSGCL